MSDDQAGGKAAFVAALVLLIFANELSGFWRGGGLAVGVALLFVAVWLLGSKA